MDCPYKTYICYSEFHLFVSLVDTLSNGVSGSYILCPDEMQPLISVISIENCTFIYYKKNKIEQEWSDFKRHSRFALHRYKKNLRAIVNSTIDVVLYDSVFKKSDIYLFNDGTPFAMFLLERYKNSSFVLFEEGELIYSTRRYTINDVVKAFIGFPHSFGRSRQVQHILARFPNRLPRSLQKKAHLYSLQHRIDELSQDDRHTIMRLFNVDESILSASDRKSVILITQPLSEDDIITEDEKLNLYDKILSHYDDKEYVKYIKPHPRELTKYAELNERCRVLASHFPVELLTFIAFSFDEAITLFSTAIHLVPAAKCTVLGLDYNKKVEHAWKRRCGVKKKL